jgi:cystathionine beta-lyase
MKYDFDKEINRLNTHSYKWDLLGEEYLPLWVADSDFKVAPAVIARLQKRLDHGIFGYFLTGNEIYDSLIGWFDRIMNVSVPDKSWIKLLSGIVPALAVASNLGNGKSITNTPNYVGLLEAPGSAGNELIRVPLKNEDEHYTIDFEALQAAITEDTKIFYLCNPHNPVGKVYTLEELKAVSEFARKNNLIVISDEAHCEIVFEGKHIPFFAVDDYARENSITIYSNGKLCNLPDLILSFAVIPNEELRKKFEKAAYALGEEHVLNVEAGIACYSEIDDWKAELLDYLKGNRDYLETELRKRFPKAKMPHSEATYLQWVDFTPYGEHVNAGFFKNKAKIFFTPGKGFGDRNYIRINFGTQRSVLEKALDLMEKTMKEEGYL